MKTKYYEQRKREMVRLRFSEGKTLKEIGEVYGLTRERVRQIIGVSSREFSISKWTREKYKEIDVSGFTKEEIDEFLKMPGTKKEKIKIIRGSWHMTIDGDSGSSKGNYSEKIISLLLSINNIEHTLKKLGYVYDIDVYSKTKGKLKVDVKYASKKSKPKSQPYEYYRFAVRKNKKGNYVDYFILMINKDVVFVVPNNDIPEKCAEIRIVWPNQKKKSKYNKYLNKFDLLK